MKVSFNAFSRQWEEVRSKSIEALDRVGQKGWYILGAEVAEFERELASQWKLDHAIGCANGLDAIEIGLRALGLKAGEKVLTTPLSAFATTLAIIRAGGVPVFVDVDDSGLIDLELSEKLLAKDPSIKYFVPVHLYGHCLDLNKLKALKEKFNIKIVEDCAQSILAGSGNLVCGSIGEVATTSFYPTKNLGCIGDGGAVLCRDSALAKTIRSLRDYGQTEKYKHTLLGLNSRLDEVQAAFLREFLSFLSEGTVRRTQTAQRYLAEIKNDLIAFPSIPEGSVSVWHLFPTLAEKRDQFQAYLKQHEIDTAIHYPIAIPSQQALDIIKFEMHGDLEVTQKFCDQELSLPIHPYLTEEEVSYVIDVCNKWRL